MSVKVSVVVPVYNAVGIIDECVDSLLRQTMPPEDFEVLFVDDGSTDETRAHLDALASAHQHFRVITIPNSGWPGKPRNTGVAEARGEYVQFLDQDDHLASDALHRLYELGRRNKSDIVLGKVASNFRAVPHPVFKEDREQCDVHTAPLFESLTPHKMFHTGFLRDKGIAYPEGKFYLEDQPYMMHAYLQAERVSILGSYVTYYYWARADGNHAGHTKIVPSEYARSVREVLEVVCAHTRPGELRDRILRRLYRVEILGCLAGHGVYKYDPEHFDELFDLLRKLEAEYFTDAVHDDLGAVLRPRSAMLRAGDAAGFQRSLRLGSDLNANARVEAARWTPAGDFEVDVTARFVHGEDRAPLRLVESGGRYLLPSELTDGTVAELMDVTDEIEAIATDVVMHGRSSAVEWYCPSAFTATVEADGEGRAEVVLRGTATIPVEGTADRTRVSQGFWDLWVPIQAFGKTSRARLGADRAEGVDAECIPAVLGSPGRGVVPYFTSPHDNLSFDVGARSKKLCPAMEGRALELAARNPIELRLDLFTTPQTKALKPLLTLTGPAGNRTTTVQWRRMAGRVHLQLPARLKGVAPGTYTAALKLDGPTGADLPLGKIELRRTGTLKLEASLPDASPDIKNAVASRHRTERLNQITSLPKRLLRKATRAFLRQR